jgi:hypothetical protein
MVTGVETAGLVLASIPLAVSLAEQYRSGLKPFRDLRHFHREFKSHAVQVGTQHAIFRKNLDKLLRQLVPAAEAELLMRNPGGLAWTDAQLEQKFKHALGESYGPIIDNIAEINRVIDKLKKGLGATSVIVRNNFLSLFLLQCFHSFSAPCFGAAPGRDLWKNVLSISRHSVSRRPASAERRRPGSQRRRGRCRGGCECILASREPSGAT